MQGVIIRWAINAGGLLLVSYLFDGIEVRGLGWAFVAALFLGIMNALIRPVIFLLTLPITIVTLGLFTLVINAFMLWLTGWLLSGFAVHGFWTAVGGALILGGVSLATNSLMNERGRMEVISMQQGPGGRWENRS